MKNLKGRNAILTGGSYGLGTHIGRLLAKEGINVALAARSPDKLEKMAAELSSMGVKAVSIPTDLANPDERDRLIERAEEKLGPIDILINNASLFPAGQIHLRTPDEIDQAIQINLCASIMLTRMMLPRMKARKNGHIVFVSSLAGKIGMSYASLYSATKYGQVGFNHALQAELAGTGVRSSVVCPGFVSGEGMWARINQPSHFAFGTSTPERVSQAVITVIKKNKVQKLVNPLPVWHAIAISTFAPRLILPIFGALGINKFMHKIGRQFDDNATERS